MNFRYCVRLSVLDCVPRADVIFIQFDNNPDDAWAIDQIDIDVYFKLGPDMEYRHKFHFEHAVLRPCYSWIADKRAYQIGPRNALFISYECIYDAESISHIAVDNGSAREAASTRSSFSVHLASIDFDNKFNSWLTIQSEKFLYDDETRVRTFKLYNDCAPRADAIFIRFDNQPEDAWAIDYITVGTTYSLGPSEDHEQRWHFEHPVLMPCSSWLEDSMSYQIGPRNGLFIARSYSYKPHEGEWIRDWV
ncbi:unnamed protein product [Nippostrongylus brasiliensis]|uniref:Carb-bd_dom_fam9 domain-containing protein n=1 Tax=Nippostrongylus brasiliensis TaxID=27835 RepID=A0A0N4XUW7_NIPBR|nr:unnamed protein product [Nippostrongylus brasiliensis]